MLSLLVYIILFILHNTQEEGIIMFTLRCREVKLREPPGHRAVNQALGFTSKFVSPIHHTAELSLFLRQCEGRMELADANNKEQAPRSTGKCIQYPVISYNGKHIKDVYTCITESLCSTGETNTTL